MRFIIGSNWRGVPVPLIRRLCTQAARSAGLSALKPAGPVAVRITSAGRFSHGLASNSTFVREDWLMHKRTWRSVKWEDATLLAVLACVEVWPNDIFKDSLERAEKFYHLLVHEFAHVRDSILQRRGKFLATAGPRTRWIDRPQEWRAISTAARAEKYRNVTVQDLIIELALAIDKEA